MFPLVSPNRPLDQQPAVSLPRPSDFPAFRLALLRILLFHPHLLTVSFRLSLHLASTSFHIRFIPPLLPAARRAFRPALAISSRRFGAVPLALLTPYGTLPLTLWIAKSYLVSLDFPRGIANEPAALRYSDHIPSGHLEFYGHGGAFSYILVRRSTTTRCVGNVPYC